MNKMYTNISNNDTVRIILDKGLTKTMDKAIISNNIEEKSLNISQMKEDLSAKPRHLIQVVNRRTGLSSDVIRGRRDTKPWYHNVMIQIEWYTQIKISTS